MALIKCIGCYELLREVISLEGKEPIVYKCPHYFPYYTAIGGLLRPGKGIIEAGKNCPQRIDEHCILCPKPHVSTYGEPPMVYICKEHGEAWGRWLEQHPERRAYLAPKGRNKKSNWIEVFREFIEDMRVDMESALTNK